MFDRLELLIGKESIKKIKEKHIVVLGLGGVGGFCEFLETINGDDPEEKKSYKTWARSLGWTGRMPKPENML